MSITLMALAMAAAASPDTVVGRWKTETRNGIVEITHCGQSLCGKLLSSDGITANPALKDVKNKDEKLRGRALKGVQLLGGFTLKNGVWDGGTIYNAEDGKTYDARITPVDANTLKLRGCVFVPLCKNQTWTRVR
ncbi:DUF2147 domain-containing protein [Sphingomonas sp. SRS2]|uniref:DUF2147 domain-containing protein n=1 Tax=Sphingomonas sp. SRS2 TaxID=133190 RepID=UPI0006184C19|nr:DUF2147 domain-containing protein [Sphingomonas sp. SRS2]KKC26300.1 hypothetical protein WP12_09545 [Sphingomonas sp. SRS2]